MKHPPTRSLWRYYLPLGIIIGVASGLIVSDFDSPLGTIVPIGVGAIISGLTLPACGWAIERRRR